MHVECLVVDAWVSAFESSFKLVHDLFADCVCPEILVLVMGQLLLYLGNSLLFDACKLLFRNLSDLVRRVVILLHHHGDKASLPQWRFALSLVRTFCRAIENKASCLIKLDHRTDRLFAWI